MTIAFYLGLLDIFIYIYPSILIIYGQLSIFLLLFVYFCLLINFKTIYKAQVIILNFFVINPEYIKKQYEMELKKRLDLEQKNKS